MNRRLWLLSAMWLLAACGGGSAPEGDRVRVVATLPPLAWVAEAGLGDGSEATVLIPRGASPHGFELPASGAIALERARVVLGAGGADAAALASLDPGDARLLTFAGIDGGADHHPWLSVDLMRSFALEAVRTMEEAGLTVDRAAVRSGIERAERDQGVAAQAIGGRSVLVVTGHDAWSAFFGSIGIDDVIAIRRGHAGEPAASTLVGVRDRAAEAEAVLVVLEPGEDTVWLESLAAEVGAATVTLDPVGTRDWPGDMAARYEAVRAALESLR